MREVFALLFILLFVSVSFADYGGWFWQHPLVPVCELKDIEVLSSSVYIIAGQSGVVEVTFDAGESWEFRPICSDFSVNSIAFSRDGFGYAVGSDGQIFETADFGVNWAPISAGTTFELKDIHLFGNLDTAFVVGAGGVILRTVDWGVTWDERGEEVVANLSAVDFPGDGDIGYTVGEMGQVFKTTDFGDSWEPCSTGIEQYLYDVDFVSPDTGFAVGLGGRIIRTFDGGENWSILPSGTYNAILGVEFPFESGLGFVCGYQGIMLSTEHFGNLWENNSLPDMVTLNRIAVTPETLVLAVGSSGSIYSYNPVSLVWTRLSPPTPDWNFRSVAFADEGNLGLIVGSRGSIFYTTDSGNNWVSLHVADTTVDFKQVKHLPDGRFVAVSDSSLFLFDGVEFSDRFDLGFTLNDICFSAGRYIMVDDTGVVGFSTGDLSSWSRFPVASEDLNYITSYDSLVLTVGDNGTALLSSDAGRHWTPIPTGFSSELLRAFIRVTSEDTLFYAVGSEGVLISSSNLGATWGMIATGVIENFTDIAFTPEDTIWYLATTSGNIFKTTDDGVSWRRQVSHTTLPINGIVFPASVDTGFAIGNKGMILRTNFGGEWFREGIDEETAVSVPRGIEILAYPNPFNAELTISFDNPACQKIYVEVLNILGERVSVLADGVYPAGNIRLHWNATTYASGIYIIHLKTKCENVGSKILLLK